MNDVRASIDIGSNSILLLIAEISSDGKLIEKEKLFEVTALGKGLDRNGVFSEESKSLSFKALQDYVTLCEKYGIKVQSIIATATEAARVATDACDFFNDVKDKLGLTVHIINPQAEIFFSTKGILSHTQFDSEFATIMDIGGASTELIKINTKDFTIMESISIPVGAVRCSGWLDDNHFVQSLQKIFIDHRPQLDNFQSRELICVAGTITSLGNMHLERKEFVEDDVHGMELKIEDIDQLFKKYSSFDPAQFLELFPFLGKRSESIRGGLHLAYHLTHRLFVKSLSISTYGLRYGTLIEGSIKEEDIFKGA